MMICLFAQMVIWVQDVKNYLFHILHSNDPSVLCCVCVAFLRTIRITYNLPTLSLVCALYTADRDWHSGTSGTNWWHHGTSEDIPRGWAFSDWSNRRSWKGTSGKVSDVCIVYVHYLCICMCSVCLYVYVLLGKHTNSMGIFIALHDHVVRYFESGESAACTYMYVCVATRTGTTLITFIHVHIANWCNDYEDNGYYVCINTPLFSKWSQVANIKFTMHFQQFRNYDYNMVPCTTNIVMVAVIYAWMH